MELDKSVAQDLNRKKQQYMKLILVVNEERFFLSHRLPLALAAMKQGFDVCLVAKNTGRGQECVDICSKYGNFKYIDFPVNPTGMNPIQEMKTLLWLINVIRKERPDVAHLVGLKCMLWGGLASKLVGVPRVINAVSGLGVLFSSEKLGFAARAMLTIMKFSNRKKGARLIFQNNDDKTLFLNHRVMTEDQCVMIKGSGVDLNEYDYTPESAGDKVNVIFTARMVKEKGVCDLVEAAKLLKDDYCGQVEFWLCGGLSSNPKALKEDELKAMCDGNYIQWLGYRSDVKELLKKSHIVAFPSYYREGVPKSLIEASAIGRPIITCNSVGCKDVVVDGENGFLIEPCDVNALVSCLRILIDNKSMREKMGQKSREFAMRDFSIETVVNAHLKLYLGE